VPIFALLGNSKRTELPAYVSGLRVQGLEAKIDKAKKLCESGFAGVKLFTGETVDSVDLEVRELRSAIGDDAFLAMDAICKYELPDATKVGKTLDDTCAAWFEAPLNAEDINGHAALARAIATPIAIGETLRTSKQFEPWLRGHALEIAQPDVMRCGVTGTLRIAALGNAAEVPTALHTGVCTGIGMAATWHVAAHLPELFPQEHQHDLFEVAGKILLDPLIVRRGKLIVPQKPGLGVNVNEQAVAASSSEHWIVSDQGRRRVRPAN
jgi:L-alanine-DL-glutamate epimerase-like enolase superfamily enzyme